MGVSASPSFIAGVDGSLFSEFEYCVRAFNMSEGPAYKKIRAARAARRFPAILEMLADGRLNLSVVVVLASKLTEHLAAELLDAAVGKTRTMSSLRTAT